MLKKKDPTTHIFIRGISVKNRDFINRLAKKYNYKLGEVINTLLDKQRSQYDRKGHSKRSIRTNSKSK